MKKYLKRFHGVMVNKKLPNETKLIYAYIISYVIANGDTEGFDIDYCCDDLGMDKHEFVKHFLALVEKDYISDFEN